MPLVVLLPGNDPAPGVDLLSPLGYPEFGKDREREHASRQLRKQAAASAYARSSATSLDEIATACEPVDAIASPPPKEFFRRIRTRDLAASFATPLILKDMGIQLSPPRGARRTSQRSIIEAALDLGWANDRSDFRTRILKPSLPVLHLALSFQLVKILRLQAGEPLDYFSVLTDVDLIKQVVAYAEPIEVCVRDRWGATFPSDQTWRFGIAA